MWAPVLLCGGQVHTLRPCSRLTLGVPGIQTGQCCLLSKTGWDNLAFAGPQPACIPSPGATPAAISTGAAGT